MLTRYFSAFCTAAKNCAKEIAGTRKLGGQILINRVPPLSAL